MMSRPITAALTLAMSCWLLGATVRAESRPPDLPPPPMKCTCNDQCKSDPYGRHYCYIYSSSGDGWCDYTGPGKACSNKEQGPPLPPDKGTPDHYLGQEPGYPESDPWYEDMKAVNPGPDAGPQSSDGGEDSPLVDRSGCSVPGGQVPWLPLLLVGALCWQRRRMARPAWKAQ